MVASALTKRRVTTKLVATREAGLAIQVEAVEAAVQVVLSLSTAGMSIM